jgi:hypothetical protein
MTQPICIHPMDDAAEVRARHKRIEDRLDELGHETVRALLATGGLPTNWNLIVHAWLSGDRLEPEKTVTA